MELLILWLLFPSFSAAIAHSRKRSAFNWFLIGLFFGPFGLLVGFFPVNDRDAELLGKLKTLTELKQAGTLSEHQFAAARQGLMKEYGVLPDDK